MDEDFKWKLRFVRHLMYMRKVNWIFIVVGVILLIIFGIIFFINAVLAGSYLTAKYKVHTEATLISVTEDYDSYTERQSDGQKKTKKDTYYELTYEYELDGETKQYTERSSYNFYKVGHKEKITLYSDDGEKYYRSDVGVFTVILLIISTAFIVFALWMIIKVIVILVKHIEPPPIPGSEEEEQAEVQTGVQS